MKSQQQYKPHYSFEFFPPKTEESTVLLRLARDKLAARKPRFFSVTFGAGGSTREKTYETVMEIKEATGMRQRLIYPVSLHHRPVFVSC